MKNNTDIQFNVDQRKDLISYLDAESRSDASPTIRGFIFQNLIAINELFSSKTDGVVLCECVEDVMFFGNDGSLKVFQAKHYSDKLKNDDLCEVTSNLFYDYMHFRDSFVIKASDSDKPLVLCTSYLINQNLASYSLIEKWIKKKQKKQSDEEKKSNSKFNRMIAVFQKAKKEDFKAFYMLCNHNPIGDIADLKSSIGDLLISFLDSDLKEKLAELMDKECIKYLLLSYTYQIVLDSLEKKTDTSSEKIDIRRISRTEIVTWWKTLLDHGNEELPLKTLLSFIDDYYWTIIYSNANMNEDIAKALEIIYKNTKTWIIELFETNENQLSLIKTICSQALKECDKWNSSSVKEKNTFLYKEYKGINSYFKHLWKIIIDTYFYHGKEVELLKIDNYLESAHGYIRFKYGTKPGVILPDAYASSYLEDAGEYIKKLKELKEFAPRIWYMGCDSNLNHKHSYDLKINKYPKDSKGWKITGADDESIFIVECMKCIPVDEGEWEEIENCDDCIFSDFCGGESKW